MRELMCEFMRELMHESIRNFMREFMRTVATGATITVATKQPQHWYARAEAVHQSFARYTRLVIQWVEVGVPTTWDCYCTILDALL